LEEVSLRGIDTNVVVRLLLRDDPAQIEHVDALVSAGDLFVPFTVLIETEWVLRAVYELDRQTITMLLRSLAVIEGVSVPDRAGFLWACDRHAKGADFADMLHLLATEAPDFLTFDRDFVRLAGRDAPCTVALIA
jgi:predicted nucleic-acid-binding protein